MFLLSDTMYILHPLTLSSSRNYNVLWNNKPIQVNSFRTDTPHTPSRYMLGLQK